MADALDAPTIFRSGSPTLGEPVLTLGYRPVGPYEEPPPPIPAVTTITFPYDVLIRRLADHEARLADYGARLALLERPWWTRLWAWLKGFFDAQ